MQKIKYYLIVKSPVVNPPWWLYLYLNSKGNMMLTTVSGRKMNYTNKYRKNKNKCFAKEKSVFKFVGKSRTIAGNLRTPNLCSQEV